MKRVLIAGGTGFIGQLLAKKMSLEMEVSLLTRNTKCESSYPLIDWEDLTVDVLSQFSVVINLSGENIAAKRWFASQKEKLLLSRIESTQKLVNLLLQCPVRPFFINASAVGIYPSYYNQKCTAIYDEAMVASSAGNFLQKIALAWEAPVQVLKEQGIPYAITRFAVVLGKEGGMLKKLLPSFRLGLGAVIGSGQQGLPWVDVNDLVRALVFIVKAKITGEYNIVAPEKITQEQFADTLTAVLDRPRILRLPAWAVNLMFGEMGRELLLSGQQVSGEKLSRLGFEYRYKTLSASLKNQIEA